MSYVRGNQGYVMLSDKQTALTTAKTPTYTGTIAAGEDLQEIQPNKQVFTDRIRNRVAPSYTQVGKKHVEGSLTFDDLPDEALGINLAMVMGALNEVAGDVSTGYTHTFNSWSACTDFPTSGVTIQKLVGGCTNAMLADNIGMFGNTFTYNIDEEGICTYGVGYMGVKNQFAVSSLSTPSYSSVSPFEGWMASIEVGVDIDNTAAINLKTATIEINNNGQLLNDHNASNRYPSAFVPGSRTTSVSITLTQEDSLVLYNYFKNNTENAAKIIVTHPTLAGTNSGVYSRTFYFPRITWMGEEPKLDSSDVLTGNYTFECLWDETEGYDVKVDVVNSQSGTYSV